MDNLKREIANTILMPDFLKDWSGSESDKGWAYEIIYQILDLYYSAVKREVQTSAFVKRTCFRIDRSSYELQKLLTPNQYLQTWLWIGSIIEVWIDFAVELEEYEVASNLKKILNSEYV